MGKSYHLKMLILTGLFAAITVIFARISFTTPLSESVPFTLSIIAVTLTGAVLGSRYGALAMIVYLLLGIAGAPVFAQGTSGIGIIVGKTGGYLIGYVVAAFVVGWIVEQAAKRDKLSYGWFLFANLVGLFFIYLLGAFQLKLVLSLTWGKALAAGVYPFVPFDIIKMMISAYLGSILVSRLISAGQLSFGKSHTV
ncbi:biotin transporter BioY [Microaerobacter geothermalis]|uniref:biotin transporter BioY n=1 Tax=Microaerobacter geothermalis TaxID=674972 RepID=UPI001F1EC6B5|nr:biotin transporter BioY [Microaerobacter geothermalis]MCF6092614.1 biotin transporter BioY [Microaerobacter geothermalis]